MLYQLSYEATHWEQGQIIEFISPLAVKWCVGIEYGNYVAPVKLEILIFIKWYLLKIKFYIV